MEAGVMVSELILTDFVPMAICTAVADLRGRL